MNTMCKSVSIVSLTFSSPLKNKHLSNLCLKFFGALQSLFHCLQIFCHSLLFQSKQKHGRILKNCLTKMKPKSSLNSLVKSSVEFECNHTILLLSGIAGCCARTAECFEPTIVLKIQRILIFLFMNASPRLQSKAAPAEQEKQGWERRGKA